MERHAALAVLGTFLAACQPSVYTDFGLPSDDTGLTGESGDGPGDGPGDSNDDGPGGDDIVEGCPDVCWGWNQRVAPTPSAPGRIVVDTCNASGLVAGVCPTSMPCGGTATGAWGPLTSYDVAVCEGTGGPYTLVAELSPEGPAQGKDVELTFTLLGDDWPGGGQDGDAGLLVLVPRSGGAPLRLPLPVKPNGVLQAKIPPDTYDASFSAGAGHDARRYPFWDRTAVLAVVDDGEEEVDVRAKAAEVRLFVDGTRYDAVPAGTPYVNLTLTGQATGTSVFWAGAAGTALGGTTVVPFDTYDATVTATNTTGTGPFPDGVGVFEGAGTITARDDVLRIDVTTAEVGGTVKINNNAHSALPYTKVRWRQRDTARQSAFEVTGTNPGRFSGRVWPGRYDVLLDATLASSRGLPAGSGMMASDVAPTTGTTFNAKTTSSSGTVTRNGAAPGNGYRGTISYQSNDGSYAVLGLATSGSASYSGPVWQGPGDVILSGDGTRLPSGPITIADGIQFAGSHSLNVQAYSVTIVLKVDGQHAVPDGSARGSVAIYPVDGSGDRIPRTDAPGVWGYTQGPLPTSGNAVTTVLLAAGTYDVGLFTTGDGGLPPSTSGVGTLVVDRAKTVTYDLQTQRITVRLEDGGQSWPSVGAGNRGRINWTYGFATIPRTGTSEVTLRVLDDELGSLTWYCNSAFDCALDDAYVPLWVYVRP